MAEEVLTAEGVQKRIQEIVGESVKAIMEKTLDQQRKDHQSFMEGMLSSMSSLKETPKAEKGMKFASYVRCLAATKGHGGAAADLCKKQGGDAAVIKALGETGFATGGALVPEVFSGEVIELLRSYSAFMSLGPTMLPMNRGSLTIPYISAGATASYVGENANISKQEQTFGQLLLSAKKLAVLTPISNDLLRDGGPMVDRVVRDDLVAALGERADAAFIRDDGTVNKPKGLYYWAVSGNKYNAANAATGADGSTLAEITADLGRAVQKLMDAKIKITRAGWLFGPRVWRKLFTIRDGNGNLVFADEMRMGTLFGYPFKVTQQIPTNLTGSGGSADTEVYFADFSSVVIGESSELEISAGDGVAYHDGSNVISAFSQDQTVIRAIERHDLGCRQRGNEVAVIERVRWGE